MVVEEGGYGTTTAYSLCRFCGQRIELWVPDGPGTWGPAPIWLHTHSDVGLSPWCQINRAEPTEAPDN